MIQNDDKKECFQSSSSNISSEYLETCDCPLECKTEEFTFDVGSLLVFIENVENEKSDGQRSLAVIPVCSVKASRS